MIFKSSTVALMVTAAFAAKANAVDVQEASNKLSTGQLTISTTPQNEITSSFEKKDENIGVYLIGLAEKSALDPSYDGLGADRSSIINLVEKQQEQVIAAIRELDPSAIITHKARLTENILYVQMSHQAVKDISTNEHVIYAELLNEEPSYTSNDEFKKYPFLTVKDPGDAVTVAIVGNGIDYTHKSLGGAGTREAYDQAWANRSNAWDGFPTETIIGGLDFSAAGEGYHSLDYNPIEAEQDDNVDSGAIPSGTAVAAQVLAEAPDAKILFYKTWDWDYRYFYPVLDAIVDPNQDGDISDRPDVIVMNSYGNAAFYVEDDTSGSHPTREIGLIRRVSAAGSLLVIGAGKTAMDNYFNLAWRAAVPEALTVGSVSINEEDISLSSFTPAGPTRGVQLLKPEVVGPAENVVAPLAGTGTEQGVFEAHHTYAAAYAAGTAARILAQFPHLSPIEAKALVTNSALADNIVGGSHYFEEYEMSTHKIAEVPFMGSGLVDGATAITSKAVVWESSSYQPSLAFGFVEASTQTSVTRDITIKNLTDQVQTYTVGTTLNGDKANNEAVSFIYPETINVPANRSVIFTVTLSVDAEKLTDGTLTTTTDYTIENWSKTSVNGYLVFNNQDGQSAQLKMPWQVFPKSNKEVAKPTMATTTTILPYDAPIISQLVRNSGGWLESTVIDVKNEGNLAKTVYTMPLMHTVPVKDTTKASGQGNLIKNIGATINPEALCESGQKLSVAVQMFDKFDVPMAEHFDKAGHVLVYFTAYAEAIADKYNADPHGLEVNSTDADKLGYFEILLNNDSQPVTKYLDLSIPYEYWNPTGRVRYSELPADVSPGDDTAVANICLDKLYHHDFQSVDAWNQKVGWQFATDRDAQSTFDSKVLRYNPVINGDYYEEVIDHTGEDGYPYWWDYNCQPKSWNEDYCIEEKVTYLASSAAVTLLSEEDQTPIEWGIKQIIEPGQSARISAGTTYQCDPNVVSVGNWIVHEDCYPGVMIFEIGNENNYFTGKQSSVDPSVKANQSFNVYENAAAGTVIGKVGIASNYFFWTGSPGPIYQVNSLPGTPFLVATDGTITVANSDALDYENTKSYVIKLHADYVNRDSKVVDVVININNRNDIAPTVVEALSVVAGAQGESVEISLSASFVDAEGDGITFTSTDLPQGLVISKAGVISGTLNQVGTYQATVAAHDGVNTTSSTLNFNVTAAATASAESTSAPEQAAPESDSEASSTGGGSTNSLFILLAALTFINRRVRK
ncbi:S8 family serine peptidase [Thalassotalea nanhaiensis]|uniref:S8 family serine peptidase n=1 Tax=Thalassotalea nanhaiensis TaxID=3065648 RepID=A0ABY9TE80_9GAMM|nr:S8 family serine peptidase [Colwelliaceae bacterium SQ345]